MNVHLPISTNCPPSKSLRCKRFLLCLTLTGGLGLCHRTVLSQPANPPSVPSLFYLIENRQSGDVIRRGTVEAGGLVPNDVNLAPQTIYREWLYDPATKLIGFEDFQTPTAGQRIHIPPIHMHIPAAPDTDGDGLSDDAEYVIGTDPNKPDTDGDGVPDGAAVQQGLNPLQGRPVITGVIGSVATPGTAMDVYAQSGVAVLAAGSAGVIVFDTSSSANPIRVAQVGTPSDAVRVAGSGNLIAVAASSLLIVDVSTPSQARIMRQVNLGSSARAVAAAAGIAFAGTSSGVLVSVDMASGTVLARANAGAIVHDLAFGGDALFVLAGNQLLSFRYDRGGLELLGTAAASPFIPDGITGAKRLFIGGGIAYATSYPGYDTFSVTNPAAIVRLGSAVGVGFNAFKQIVANGSGLGLAAVGVNPRDDGTHNLSLYNVSNPLQTTNYITTLTTPGLARAVSIYNGLAYVADGSNGLTVLNYLAYDTHGIPPTISLSASFSLNPAVAEEGKIARVTAQVTDGVQVRNVEFYIDGQKVLSDGNFPFEYRFVTPSRSLGRTNFTVQARAFDTGGNATWSQLFTVALSPDLTPPFVLGTLPSDGAILGALAQVMAAFSEPVNPAALTTNSFRLATVGPDGLPGTADDVFVPGGIIIYNSDMHQATLAFPTNLAPGGYAITVRAPVADLAGNALAPPAVTRFWITGGVDSDQDGIPDDIEVLMGYDPHNPDSFGDGVWDGDRDFDGDGLSNKWEIQWGYDPTKADTDGNGIADGLEDPDHDGLNNLQEQAAGTNPFMADSDGDGWPDAAELTAGSDPLQASSRPKLLYVSRPPLTLDLARPIKPTGLSPNVSVSRPPVQLTLPKAVQPVDQPLNVRVSRPPLQLTLPQAVQPVGLPLNVRVSRPPVQLTLPKAVEAAGLPRNTTLSQPPVQLHLPAP